MARIVVLGAGISGHTAALHLRRLLKSPHEVVVVTPNSQWNWIPSNIWVGVGRMKSSQVTFPLRPVYQKKKITYVQAKAVALHPEGDSNSSKGFVDVVYTDPARSGETDRLDYDYLINATGPKLNFAATPGLGPDGHTLSVCTYGHAEQAAVALTEVIRKLKSGLRQRLRVHLQRRTRTARSWRAGTRRGDLPDQRVRTRRFRCWRAHLQAAGLHHD
jgi:sulfide:quinone oxidoreductase